MPLDNEDTQGRICSRLTPEESRNIDDAELMLFGPGYLDLENVVRETSHVVRGVCIDTWETHAFSRLSESVAMVKGDDRGGETLRAYFI